MTEALTPDELGEADENLFAKLCAQAKLTDLCHAHIVPQANPLMTGVSVTGRFQSRCRSAGMSQDLPAAADPEPVIYDYQVDRLPSPKAAMRLSGSSSDLADDCNWVDRPMAVLGAIGSSDANHRF